MGEPQDSQAERESLEALAAYVDRFEALEFRFGEWDSPEDGPDGEFTMPMFLFSDEAAAFVRACYEHGWVSADFDWPAWKETEEASQLGECPQALSMATMEQLRRLLTVVLRQDRFVEGSLEGHYESGLLTRIVRRAKDLLAEA